MASGVYNRYKNNLHSGFVDFNGSGAHQIKIALLSSSYTFDADHNVWSSVSAYEVTGTGYTTGGQALSNVTLTQDDVNNRAYLDADDVSWPASTITARYAVLYDDTLSTKDLICVLDFGSNQVSSGGTFAITFSSSGIIRID